MQTDHSRSVEEFRDKFVGRLSALARAHSLLLDAEWRGADLRELVEQALEAYRVDHPDTIEIDGEPVPLTASQSLGLSLILHELGTNAAKYGALSHRRRTGACFLADRGAQARQAPAPALGRAGWSRRRGTAGEKGFGTRLIERACTYELEGEVELDYAPAGLRCEVVFPLA